MTTRAYLDAAGAARPDPTAMTGLQRALNASPGDPHRRHAEGQRAQAALEAAQQLLARTFGVRPNDVVFTSSHAQAVQTAVRAIAAARSRVGDRIVASQVERTTVLQSAAFAGTLVTIGVDEQARVRVDELEAAVDRHTALVAVQAANGELGTRQPIDQVHEISQASGVPLLVDAGSTVGNMRLDDAWDALVLDAGEWGAPIRLGVLVVRSQTRLRPVWPEDADAWFPGGVAPAAAFAAAVALDSALARLAETTRARSTLVDRIRQEASNFRGVRAAGDPAARLPHVVTLTIDDVDGEALAAELDRRGVAVGTGSACSSSTIEPSHVLRAAGLSFDGSIRITLDAQTTDKEVTLFLREISPALEAVRGEPS